MRTASGKHDPDELTAWVLVRAYHAVARLFYVSLRQVDLTPSQFGVLVELDRDPQQHQAEIARRVLATPQATGELLRGMEDRGLVVRSSAGRGSPVSVALTAQGNAALAAAWPVVLSAVGTEALGLDDADDRVLNELLRTVVARLAED